MINLSQTTAIHRALRVARPAAEPIYTDGDSLCFSEGGRMYLAQVRNAAASLGRYIPAIFRAEDIGADPGPGVARRGEAETLALLSEADRDFAMPKASAWDPTPTEPGELKLRPPVRLIDDLDGDGYARALPSEWDPDPAPSEEDVIGRLRPGATPAVSEADDFTMPKPEPGWS